MKLKFRYASALLLVAMILILSCWATVYLLTNSRYVLAVLLLVLLYLVTFQLGKKLSKVFFTLSFLQTLKKRGGIVRVEDCDAFINKVWKKNHTTDEVSTMVTEILDTLVLEKIIEIHGDKLVLIDP